MKMTLKTTLKTTKNNIKNYTLSYKVIEVYTVKTYQNTTKPVIKYKDDIIKARTY